MSVASLNNGQLQLAELVISNEKYSNASGYIASSSSFSSSVSGTQLTLGADPTSVNLLCNGPGSLIVEGTITTNGGLTAQNGTLTLGTSPASVVLTGTTGTLTVTGGITANGADINGNLTTDSLTVGSASAAGTAVFQLASSNPSNFVNMSVSSTNPNFVNISTGITTGTINASYYGGGLYAVQYNTPVSVPANSSVNISIPNLPYNPIAGWSAASIYPQFTIVSQFGELGLSAISLVKDAGGLLDITLTVYNPNATNPQNLTLINGLLFYQ